MKSINRKDSKVSGTLLEDHPKYALHASKKYEEGKFDGNFGELKVLLFDRIDPSQPYYSLTEGMSVQ